MLYGVSYHLSLRLSLLFTAPACKVCTVGSQSLSVPTAWTQERSTSGARTSEFQALLLTQVTTGKWPCHYPWPLPEPWFLTLYNGGVPGLERWLRVFAPKHEVLRSDLSNPGKPGVVGLAYSPGAVRGRDRKIIGACWPLV